MPGELIREQAAALDAEDPLAGFRGRFVVDDAGPLYCAGATLGRLAHAAAEAVAAEVDAWGTRLANGLGGWSEAPRHAGDVLGKHVLGARPGEVVVAGTVATNLGALAEAVLARAAGPIAALSGDAAADRSVLQPIAARHGIDLRLVSRAQLPHASRDARLVILSHVDPRSSEIAEMEALRPPNGLVLWDLSHSAGAVELDLHASNADLAVGRTDTYLGGGPGAPAYRYVRAEHAEALGIREAEPRTLPPVLSLAAAEAAIGIVAQAGMPVIAPKTRALTELFVHLHDQWLAPSGFVLASPRGARARGGHVALRHPEAASIVFALAREGVVADHLQPDLIRFAFPALYTRFVDVVDVAQRTRDAVS
ncbi:MAG TPA: hypothetical protein VF529_01520 [Solirubrobacteraceae bacterium]